ncbi:MAG: phosphoribosylformylglycinamidine synthase subunit PurL [Clostridia bacterium]
MRQEEILEKKVWREMGLSDDDYKKISNLLDRAPTYEEIGIFSVMWSEHCSYKHSKPELKKLPTEGKQVIQGPGENAGILDIGDNQAIVFKMESHNHPSAIEPYQGAATGVGGIVRDVFTMGARPIALLNSLRFGDLNDAHVRYLFDGVVAGIAGYGNCLGIPTVAGEVFFSDSYKGNPLVNAMCVGLVDHDKIRLGSAAGVGNAVMLIGAKTGRDGIHGATFASEELSDESEDRRPAVQVGDPFMEKLLIEACLELFDKGIVIGMQDLGAAGLTSSAAEMASREGNGIELDVSKVPLRETGMTPYEIMLSESQERMLLIVEPKRIEEVEDILTKWGLDATVIGQVTDDEFLTVKYQDKIVANISAKMLAEEAPIAHAEYIKPNYIDEAKNFDLESLENPEDLEAAFKKVISSLNVASKEWVYKQYDHMVRTNTVVLPGSDAAVIRIKGTNKGVALTSDCNPRFVYLDPQRGGKIAVSEAARNIACSGAKPLGITNCLNFGNPEKPEIFYTFKTALEGMGEACDMLNTPVTGGNVSFYNETNGKAVYPTPTIGMVGLIENVEDVLTVSFKNENDDIYLIGEFGYEIGGSQYLQSVHDLITGEVPDVNLKTERNLIEFLQIAAKKHLLNSAHDISEGGLVSALVEKSISGKLGCNININMPNHREDFVLFNESQSRVIVSLDESKVDRLLELAAKFTLPVYKLGKVKKDDFNIKINNKSISMKVEEVDKLWREALACKMAQQKIN